ncbi:hypothetical protein IE981_14655 [Klebsiella pneumoniae]|nr:hypothetical protein [Klebsiella pneumoniae]
MFPVYSLPKIVCGLLGEILASATESCEFEAMGKIGGDCRMSIQDSGQLPREYPMCSASAATLMLMAGSTSSRRDSPGWGGLCIGIMAS